MYCDCINNTTAGHHQRYNVYLSRRVHSADIQKCAMMHDRLDLRAAAVHGFTFAPTVVVVALLFSFVVVNRYL
jgi:hypothetical protein